MTEHDEQRCPHTCKGECTALDKAEKLERNALLRYREIGDQCEYPQVRRLLADLVARHEEALTLIAQTRETLDANFIILDEIRGSFEG